MKAGIYTNLHKDADLSVTKRLVQSLQTHGISCYVYENISDKVPNDGTFGETSDISELKMLLAIGGDGTLLGIAKRCAPLRIPVLGVNMGKLGFLTEAEPDTFDTLAQALAKGQYTVEQRTMLCARIGEKSFYALNEIAVLRRNVSRMITLKVYIGGAPLDTHYCDGFIVSTPTGSTAYSLSAGGPVISPTAEVFALTPVNSHSMHARPVVVGDDERISLVMPEGAFDASVVADGKVVMPLKQNETVRISKAPERALFVRWNKNGFYERLLRKLNTWSITPQEEEER